MEALGITPEDVAGSVESVSREGRRDIRSVVIAVHEGRAFHFQHALTRITISAVDEPKLDLRMRIADRHIRLWQACGMGRKDRSEEHTSELQSLRHLVCRL